MSGWRFHLLITSIFMPLLALVYVFEIQPKWEYMGFSALTSAGSFFLSMSFAILFALSLGTKMTTRNFLLTLVHYLFLIPSLILCAAHNFSENYFLALFTFSAILAFSSALPVKTLHLPRLPTKQFFFLVLLLFVAAVAVLAAYGGLNNFNLNIFRVYEFRRESAEGLPTILSYLFSGVSKVIAPMSLLLAIYFRSTVFFASSFFLIILLFGMTHHKSVLFLPVFVMLIYGSSKFLFGIRGISLLLLFLIVVSGAETVFLHATDRSTSGLINAMITRRALFTPPLLDTLYVEFFQDNQKIYWATSRFSMGLTNNPYDRAAPFLIGDLFFGREQMSANAGIIGSGFANAGMLGVTIYSFCTGLLIAFLNAYGKVIGHELVAAFSAIMILTIVSSTDLSTAILTHGLYMLVILIMVFPKKQAVDPITESAISVPMSTVLR